MSKIKMDPFLIKLAYLSRDRMEQFAKKNRRIGDFEDLGGFCAIASYFLKDVAKYFNYNLDFIRGEYWGGDHCWNEYNNYIIDITATQFKCNRRVRILSNKNRNYLNLNPKFNKAEFDTWGEQNPVLYTEQLNDLVNDIKYELRKRR